MTDWDVLGIYLGLDESEITEIERNHQSNARRRIAMFAKWIYVKGRRCLVGESDKFVRDHVTDLAGKPAEGKVHLGL